MPKTKNVFSVDVRSLAEDLALFTVTGNDGNVDVIKRFCELYSIPIDPERVAEKVSQYTLLAEALAQKGKK